MNSEHLPIGGHLIAFGPRRDKNNPDVSGKIVEVILKDFYVDMVRVKEEREIWYKDDNEEDKKFDGLTPVNPNGGWAGLYVNDKKLNK